MKTGFLSGSVSTCVFCSHGSPKVEQCEELSAAGGRRKAEEEMPFLVPWREFGPSTLTAVPVSV